MKPAGPRFWPAWPGPSTTWTRRPPCGLAREALAAGLGAYEAITEGLSKGMAVVSDKYERGVYFVPEILLCADAMYAAIDVLRPHLKAEGRSGRPTVIIGVIEGDVHDIGKNIVRLMLEAAGFTIRDLGNDVPVARFVEEARAVGQGIVAASTLMSTTMWNMERLVEELKAAGLRDRFRVMVGGGPVSASFAAKIGADAYGANAMEAVRIASLKQHISPREYTRVVLLSISPR